MKAVKRRGGLSLSQKMRAPPHLVSPLRPGSSSATALDESLCTQFASMKTGLPIIIIRWRRIEISESQIRSMPQNESGNRDRKVSINGLKTRFIAPNFPHKAIVIS